MSDEGEQTMRLKPEEVRIVNAIRSMPSGRVEVTKVAGRITGLETRTQQSFGGSAPSQGVRPGATPRDLREPGAPGDR